MRTLLTIIAAAVLSLGPCQAAADEALTPQKRADIERLLEMTEALALGQQMSSLMVAQFTSVIRQANPNIPKELLDTLPGIVNSVIDDHVATLKNAIIPIYHKHFSHNELKQMIAFYETDLGRKTIRVMPMLVQESMAAGQLWGRSLGPEIERRIRARFKKEGVSI